MATRFYLPSTGSAEVSPTFNALWDQTTAADRLKMVTTKISSSMTTKSDSDTDTSSSYYVLLRQYVSGQFESFSLTTSHTWKLQARCQEDNAKSDAHGAVYIYVVSADGSSVRGVIESGTHDVTEFDTSLENRTIGPGYAFENNIAMQDGDRVVLEIGYWTDDNKSTAYTGEINFGDDSGTDLPEDDAETNAYNPWFEISATLTPYTGTADTWTPKVIMF